MGRQSISRMIDTSSFTSVVDKLLSEWIKLRSESLWIEAYSLIYQLEKRLTVFSEAFALSLTYQFMVCFELFKKHFTPHFRANLSSYRLIVSYYIVW